MNNVKKYGCLLFIIFASCIRSYNPPALQAKNNYLVVDGFINAAANQVTTITLSRTRNLSDSAVEDNPEVNASVQVISNDGSAYNLNEISAGVYQSAALNLDNSKTYQLKIVTANGRKYSSGFTQCKTTPPIDSLTWQQPFDLNIYLNTHDPSNNSIYYKWDFSETWQYNSAQSTPYGVKNMLIYVKTAAQQTDSCWQNDLSNDVLIGSSLGLGEDRISAAKVATITHHDEKLYVKYSILVRQRVINAEAYKYWDIVKKNSQNRGSFFDLQPGQLQGNIHSESDATEPVIGYINCSSETEKRIFITNRELNNWGEQGHNCAVDEYPVNPTNFLIYDNPDTTFVPYYFTTGGPLVITEAKCVDCTRHGGTTQRPSYW